MSKLFIFSIGGSGSRVIRSLDMLLAAGVPQFKGGDQIIPIMIDYDVHNGDTKRSFECVETYHNLHKYAYTKELEQSNKTEDRFFHTRIMEMNELGRGNTGKFTMEFRHNPNDRTFGDAIAYTELKGDKSKTQDLLKTLYDVSSSDDTELGIDMTVGFKGNPNIGSVVFHSLKDSTEFDEFKRNFAVDQHDKVILIGSLFGGTGSSGIPEIVNAIRGMANGESVELGVIMIMPYFCFDAQEEKGTVKCSMFDSKTRASLSYYESAGMNKKINAIYYVGDKERNKVPYSQGGDSQKNDSHIVDLISAISILDFVTRNNDERGKQYKYRMHDTDPEHEPGYTILNFYNENISKVIKPLVTLAFAVKFMRSEVAKKTKIVTDRPYDKAFRVTSYYDDKGDVPKPNFGDVERETNDNKKARLNLHATLYYFNQFADQFISWVEELKQIGNHKLVLFDFDASIEALVQDCKLSEMSSSLFGVKKESALVDAMDFSEQIQKYYAKHYQDAAPAGGELHFKDTTAGYAFLDCLYNGVAAILNNEKIAKILKFR